MWCPRCGERPRSGFVRHCHPDNPKMTTAERSDAHDLWLDLCRWWVCWAVLEDGTRCRSVVDARNPRGLFIFVRDHPS